MLAAVNRITAGDDYRRVVRRGRRIVGANTVTYLQPNSAAGVTRFGFIVAKNVGSAVRRNRVRRRLKAACFETLTAGSLGYDVVVRALPGSSEASWDTLRGEVLTAVDKGMA